jgi:hypothetical protein|nr:MAG TPA_asm: hypothetical protein [Caudoviricetes sp.]
MITYVNTVLVSNKGGDTLATKEELAGKQKKGDLKELVGKFVFMNCDAAAQDGSNIEDIYAVDENCDRFKIGVVTSDSFQKADKMGNVTYIPVVKWSNIINAADIKSITKLDYKEDTEDTISIDFSTIPAETLDILSAGGCPVVLRLTFKDMPMRYRKWTESYSYVTMPGDGIQNIIQGLVKDIVRASKRQRVYAKIDGTKLVLEAMKYDDDEQAVTENVYAKVRFDANAYWMNPQAPGWAANNKYDLGVKFVKQEGVTYPASAKLVRDRERSAFDYQGVIHRCCWYDPQPNMVTNIDNHYGGITIEFENQYHTADDLWRRTKQTVEIYASNNGAEIGAAEIGGGLLAKLGKMVATRQNIANPVSNSTAYDGTKY